MFCLSLLALFPSCFHNYDRWDEATIDQKISQDSVYKRMDTEEEIFSAIDNDTSRKKSSDVISFIGRPDQYSKMNNCRAYFFNSDTLIINIGIGTGFGGQGFIIKFKANKFFTAPYFTTDVIMDGERRPTYELIYQKLVLNKSNYKAGDSLFGKIDFGSVGPDFSNAKHFGKGYFRAKVKRSPFD